VSKKLRLVILGMMGRSPFGGQTWLYLNWIRAFSRLGHEVYYIEDDTVWPYDPEQNTVTDDCSYAAKHIANCMRRIGLPDRWAFRLADREDACWGISARGLEELYRSCDALLNVVGATDLREEHLVAPLRVYVQTDPVIAELRLANGDEHTRIAFANHHVIATYGENYGAPDCGVPLNGVVYKKTRQPVDLDLWPRAYDLRARLFTTIGNYNQPGSDVEYNGEVYRWSKHHEWEKFLDLPRWTKQPFELALNLDDSASRGRLEAHGWALVSPLQMSLNVFGDYPAYFRRSRAEFTVAKDQNVRLRSGWFSERDACYLACGKPVVAQDTGFGNVLPTGEGLFAFTSMEEALDAIDAINGDYRRHCEAARAIAEEYFEARSVAARLLADIGLA
jgi:glycosyltransferase involved in cell wall biosynthesis